MLHSLEDSVIQLNTGITNWKTKIQELSDTVKSRQSHFNSLSQQFKLISSKVQSLQVKTMQDENLMSLQPDELDRDNSHANTLIEERKSYEKQLLSSMELVSELSKWNDTHVLQLTSGPARNSGMFAVVLESERLKKQAHERLADALRVNENSKQLINAMESYIYTPRQLLQDLNESKRVITEQTLAIYTEIFNATELFRKTISLIQKKEVEIDDVKTAQDIIVNTLSRYSKKSEEHLTELFNFKFNFPKLVQNTCNMLIQYRATQRQV